MLNLLKIITSIILSGFLLNTASAKELAQIVKEGKLRVAVMDTGMPPFMTRNEKNEYQGFELDLLKTCAGSMGVKLELVPVDDFDSLVSALTDDKADIALSQLSRIPQRILKVDFTQPYVKLCFALMINRQEMLKRRKNETLDNYLRHYDGPLIVQRVTCHIEAVKVIFPKAKLIFVENRGEVEQLINQGKLVAYFDDQIGIRSLMQGATGTRLFYQRVILEDTMDNICIAVQPNCPRLLFFLNCYIEENIKRINSILKSLL